MRAAHLRWSIPLAATAIIVGASVAFGAFRDNFTKPAAPLPGNNAVAHLTMTGRASGELRGGGPHGEINVVGLDYGQRRPFDPQTQQPTGRILCRGVRFRKPTDRSTVELFHAQNRNDDITRAVFRENDLTIELHHARIASIHHVAASSTGQYEDVTVAPRRIEFIWTDGGFTSVHECGE